MVTNNISIQILQRAIESSVTGIVIADFQAPDMPIIYANPAFFELTGYSEDEIIGINCRFLQGDLTEQKGLTQLRAAIKKKEECQVVIRNFKKDGTPFWNELSVSPILNAQEEVTHFIGIQNDITARVNAKLSLLKAKEETENANRALEAFNATVSHDLKSPIRHVSMFLSLLERKNALDESSLEYMSLIQEAVNKMMTLIDDLLTYSKTSTVKISTENVDIQGIVNEIIIPLREEYKDHKHTFTIGSLPKIHADQVLIRQVFSNLIHNAVKYSSTTPNPKISITSEEKGDFWEFKIEDNGVGFKPEYVHKIFDAFVRLHSDEEFEGTGIGLANVKNIIEKHNGKIWAEGEKGKGATFYFTLPK